VNIHHLLNEENKIMKKLKGIAKRIAAAGLAAMLVISQADVSVLADELSEVPELTEVSELPGIAGENEGAPADSVQEEGAPETGEQPAGDTDIMSFDDLQTLINNAEDGGTVILEKDVNWKNGTYGLEAGDSGPLVIPEGKTVTLDLNGHTIDRRLKGWNNGVKNANVITVSGNLTLTDGSADGTGKLTGGNTTKEGGGVFIDQNATFTMEGGSITDCITNSQGGGVNVNGTFNMTGGTISGCTANNGAGGGVKVKGTFNMTGGTISGCTGRGVFVDSGATFTMSGSARIDGCTNPSGGGVYVNGGTFTMNGSARITGCTATNGIDNAQGGGGVYLDGGTFNVSGSPVISGNKKGDKTNNVTLNYSKTITVTGALTDGAEIRVAAEKGAVIAKPGTPSGSTTAYTIKDTDAACFHSDKGDFTGAVDGGNVVFKETLPTATLDNTSMVYDGSAFSPTISFEEATLTKDSDYTLSYKKVVDTQETPLSAAPKDAGSYKLIVAGKSSYTGIQELEFTITQKPVTVVSGITVKDKEYDGGTTAELITTGAVFTGICDGDKLTVSANGAGTFADKDAGESKNVNIDATKFVLGGASAGNYKLADGDHQSTATATISKKSITITGVTANDKEYDGNTTATTVTSKAAVTGLVGTDAVTFTVSGAFADANKGNNKTVTLSNWNLTSGGTNYEIDASKSQKTTKAGITGVQVYIDGVTAQDKVYDGNKSATVTGTATLKRVNGNTAVDGLTVSNITAEFEDKNAGDNKAVTITGGTLSDSVNYTLVPGVTTGLTANIEKASRKNEVVPNETRYGLSGSIDISGYIEEGSTVSGNMTVSGNNEIFDGEPQLKGKSISYKLKDVSGNVGQRAYITAKVSGTNYKDYIITVQVEVINCDHSNRKLVEGTTIAATCIEQGYEGNYECLDCHSIIRGEKTPIDPDNHDFDGGVEVKPPTTLTMGETKYTCSRCHKEKIVADIPCKEEEGKDYEDLRKDIEGLSGNAAPVVEPVKDDKGNEIGESVKIGGKEVEKTVTDPVSGKETVESKVWIGGLKESYRYTGSAIKPSFHVYDGTRKLTEKTDYTVSWKNNKDVGTATATVKFKGNYKDAKSETVSFKIDAAVLGEDILAHEIGVAAKKKGSVNVSPVLTWAETGKAVSSKYFSITPSSVTGEGMTTASISPKSGQNNYTGSTTALIRAAGDKNKLLSNAKVTFRQKSYAYTGKPIEPEYSLSIGGKPLTENVDYRRVSLYNNTNPGTATVVFEALTGNSTGIVGSKTAAFKISGKIELKEQEPFLFAVSDGMYAMGGAKPSVIVKESGNTLKEGRDYTLSYSKNKAVTNGAKTAEVKVKGKGNYKGSVTLKFAIAQQSLKAEGIKINAADQFTTKQKLKAPKVTITDVDGKKLKANTDYTVGTPYTDDPANTDTKGIVKIRVTGKGGYKDEPVTVTYRYEDKITDISKAKNVKKIADQDYTGNVVKLSNADLTGILSAKDKAGATVNLLPGTHFTVTGYKNNIKKGTAKVTVQGIGDFAGTKTITFKIVQRQVDFKGALIGDGIHSSSSPVSGF